MSASAVIKRSFPRSRQDVRKRAQGVGKRDVQNYLRKQQKEANEPVNNTFAQALSGIKL